MLKTIQTVVLFFVLAVVGVKKCESFVGKENDVFESPLKPQVVKHRVSSESNLVKLQCNILQNSFKKNRILSINELRWESKKCGYGLHLTNCANFPTIPWTPVMCKNGSKFCDGYILKLENPRATDGGYYRCLYKNYLSKQFKVYKVFHVDIYDPEANFEILDEPLQYDNHVVHVNGTVTFRCRARSLFPLHMIWAKLVLDERRVNRLIRYGNNSYELIKNDGCHYIGNDLYISKLVLSNTQIPDSGQYYCIVISVNNADVVKNKTMTLKIVSIIHNTSHSSKSSLCIQLVLVWIYIVSHE